MKIKVVHKHPLPLRWNHWINFPLLTLMVISGLAIYWANPAYISADWLEKIGLGRRLATGLAWHFALAFVFILNGLLYFIFLLKTGHIRYLFPDRNSFKEALVVALHDFGFKKWALPAQVKYNAAQRVTYSGVFILGLLGAATGLAIYKPWQLNWLLSILGGYEAARLEHFIVMILFVLFFITHIIQVVRAGWNNFRAMISGVEVKTEEKHEFKAPTP
jgi:thiosulfate reductase cytochrome b subunit